MNKVHYICNYFDIAEKRELVTQPSGVSKIDYIKSSLIKAGFYVSIFSIAQATTNKNVYYTKKTIYDGKNEDFTYINCFGRTNVLLKILSRLWMQIQLLRYLFFNVKLHENILIYHSLVLMWPIRLFKIFSNKKIIFEVEELYNAVQKRATKKIKDEIQYLQISDGFILINDLIASQCNVAKKPYIVCYGDYRINPIEKSSFCDSFVHLVYAGGIEEEGSDVYLAIDSMKYLPENFKLHILGFGSDKNITIMLQKINNYNQTRKSKSINYHGLLIGQEYINFLSKCDIGLCPRTLQDEFSDYTFPSKVLIYLINNLIPICTPIRTVRYSKIQNCVVFTKDAQPQSLADSIIKVNPKSYSVCKDIINNLDKNFIANLRNLLNN